MRIHPLNLTTTILNRISTQAKVEAEAKVQEEKEVAKVETLTKASNKIMRIKIGTEAHMEEDVLEERGAKEDAKIIKGIIQMLVIVVARIVANQTTLKGIAHNKIKAIEENKIIMNLAII